MTSIIGARAAHVSAAMLAVALSGCPPAPPVVVPPGTGPAAGASVCRGADAYVLVPLGFRATRVAVADFDGDGVDDLAWVNGSGFDDPSLVGLFVALSHGDGTFVDPITVDAESFTSIQAIDVDNDGHPDLITTSVNSTAGNGGIFVFAWQPASSTFSGNLYFGPETIPGFRIGDDIDVSRAVDIDGDGHVDMLMTQTGTPTPPIILHGDGPGTFDTAYVDSPAVAATGYVNSFLPMDINGDGRLDLVMGYQDDLSNSKLSIGLQNSDGTFATSDFSQFGDSGIHQAVDFDEDGILDILDGGAVLHGLGGGQFELTLPFPAGTGADTAQDIDGDGFLDVGGVTDNITQNTDQGSHSLGISWGAGLATFEPSLDKFPIPPTFNASASGNLDGQRGIDFVVDGYYGGGLAVLFSRCAR